MKKYKNQSNLPHFRRISQIGGTIKKEDLDKSLKDPKIIMKIVDEQRAAQKSQIAIKKITPKVRKLLTKILNNYSSTSIEHKGKDYINIPIAPDHDEFKSLHHDNGVISMALWESSLPTEFILPVAGGIPFLKHICRCPFCQFLVVECGSELGKKTIQEGLEIGLIMIEENERRKKIN